MNKEELINFFISLLQLDPDIQCVQKKETKMFFKLLVKIKIILIVNFLKKHD